MVSRAVVKAIYEKYNHLCAICGRETSFDDGEIDHIKPKSLGGSDRPKNLQWLCHRCNKIKGDRLTNDEVRELLELGPKGVSKEIKKSEETKAGQLYRCKLSVNGRILYCGKKKAGKSCLIHPLSGRKCPDLIITRK